MAVRVRGTYRVLVSADCSGRHKDAVVGEVGPCQAVEALVNNQRQLEPHTLYHWQPMEFVQHWRDVDKLS